MEATPPKCIGEKVFFVVGEKKKEKREKEQKKYEKGSNPIVEQVG